MDVRHLDISTDNEEEEAEVPRRSSVLARFRDRPFWQRIVLVLIGFLLLPYFLIVVYVLPFIHPVSTLMIGDAVTFQGYERRWVPLDRIAPVLVKSVMVSEDGQFCFHGGVDWGEMRVLVEETLSGKSTRGGSTIPMQTVKNLFLWNSRSFVRKTLELPLAVSASAVWSKRRMMEIYLNIAEWGPGIYGIEAAARYHFKVPASKLTARQAALLAVSLPNPIDRVASKPGRGLSQLASLIQRRARNADAYIKCLYD
ncbi:monofunctional biosynthetic peptidoglycan transglycosylase [Rhizobium hainanense]|uniref:Biosynthetic peptidoglycan transglycosylase n=1 Tax=Rhizobium hainanense TaxID=52131 RepID=A0A1C3V333_9HYPH|nr:monofunctional biosynthetic peptidoglycan transglycosylase [Rhizobium hainanense]